jgi:hypothetical protein
LTAVRKINRHGIAVLNARRAGIASKAGAEDYSSFPLKAAKTLFGIDTTQ